MFKNHLIKSNHRAPRKNKVDTLWSTSFAPDYTTTVLAAKKYKYSYEHSMFIRYLWFSRIQTEPLFKLQHKFYRSNFYILNFSARTNDIIFFVFILLSKQATMTTKTTLPSLMLSFSINTDIPNIFITIVLYK
jgi:hypothetical protein